MTHLLSRLQKKRPSRQRATSFAQMEEYNADRTWHKVCYARYTREYRAKNKMERDSLNSIDGQLTAGLILLNLINVEAMENFLGAREIADHFANRARKTTHECWYRHNLVAYREFWMFP